MEGWEERTMAHRIIKKESFSIIGIELKTTTRDGKNYFEIPQFWQKVLQQRQIDNIPNKKHPSTVLGICMDFESDGRFSYIAGTEVINTETIPAGMVCKTIPAASYAVFTARGKVPDSIQNTFKYVYDEWLPKSGYRRAESAEFELYDERWQDGGAKAEVDIYIPIVFS
jgi:AraC family transcriptional regulator